MSAVSFCIGFCVWSICISLLIAIFHFPVTTVYLFLHIFKDSLLFSSREFLANYGNYLCEIVLNQNGKGLQTHLIANGKTNPRFFFLIAGKTKQNFSATTTDRNSAIFVLTKPVKCLVFRSFFDQKLREISISNVTQPQITFGKTEN